MEGTSLSVHQPPTPSRARQFSPHKSLSPSKPGTPSRRLSMSRSSPRKTPLSSKSPRKSPAKHSSAFASAKGVSFTPQRTKQPPRAWERKPATPFIPRADKQKIWKRVPLGELGVDINRPVGIRRRDQESKDYARVVKKLKIGHDGQGEDKENVVFGVAGKDCTGLGKSKADCNFVTMRMEDDELLGSPKKKLRLTPNEEELEDSEREELDEDFAGDTREETGDIDGDEAESDDADDADMQQGPASETDDQMVTDDEHVSMSEDDAQTQSSEENEVDDAQSMLKYTAISHPDTASERQTEVAPETLNSAASSADENQEPTQGGEETAEANTADPECVNLPSIPSALSVTGPKSDQQERATEVASSDAETGISDQAALEENRSSSPPTVLGENVLVDELSVKESPHHTQTPNSASNASQPSYNATEGNPNPRRISDDDAAFLRDFMSRSKASKAAREQASQEAVHSQTTQLDEQVPTGQTQIQAGSESQISPELLSERQVSQHSNMLEEEPNMEVCKDEPGQTSPLRRSKRSNVTSIPRPQSIQLRRASGNEFIFTANKASTAANVAMTTRNNTKKNKGPALDVQTRLEQLLAEQAEEEGATVEPSDKQSSKRRKGQKAKKVLRWNDARLVEYQELKPASTDDWEDVIEDSSQDNITSIDHDHNVEEHNHVKLMLACNSQSQAEQSSKEVAFEETAEQPKDTASGSPQRKVRRVRRGIVGTVNGTPAPKKRSKRLLEADESMMTFDPEDEPTLDISNAADAALSSISKQQQQPKRPETASVAPATRKSRMPVPATATATSTAVGSKRTVTGSRAGTVEKTRMASAGTSSGTKTKTEQKAEKGDLLGSRRLRVRR